MHGREIVNALIRDKTCPERMGLFEDFWPDTQAAWEQEGLPRDVKLYEYFDFDIQYIEEFAINTEALVDGKRIVEEDDRTYVAENGWGARMREWKNRPGTPEHLYFDLVNEDIWRKRYREPLLAFDIRRLDDRDKRRQQYRQAMASDRFFVWESLFLFEIMRKAMGDIVMLEAMCMNPRWIRDFCDVVTDMLIRHLDALFAEVGLPDGMWIYEDMGYTQGPFVSPRMYRELMLPYHTRICDFVHSHKIPVILHVCGKVAPLFPDVVKSGIDCLQVLEAKAGQHVVTMAESVDRKIAYMGNLDIRAFETNDPTQLEAEIVPKLKAISERRIPYVFHSDHSIPRTVKFRTYQHALEIYRRHCRY